MPYREAGVVIEQEWNERYAGSNQIWSGQPNQALVTEVSELPPGRALDVGCGEGADAVWLARRGWDVTGLDVSGVALDRARLHARDAGVVVRWMRAGLVEAGLPDQGFDLVSAQYRVPCTPRPCSERALLSAVAPGGALPVVHHAIDVKHGQAHGIDPADYVSRRRVTAGRGLGTRGRRGAAETRRDRRGSTSHEGHRAAGAAAQVGAWSSNRSCPKQIQIGGVRYDSRRATPATDNGQ
jgi:SAM-dependent methyltransferase